MKRALQVLMVLSSALTVYGDGVAYRKGFTDCWLGADFSSIVSGAPLTRDFGTTGGNWGDDPIPEGAKAFGSTAPDGFQYLAYNTGTNSDVKPLVFSADEESPSSRLYSNFKARFSSAEKPFEIADDGIQAAITMAISGKSTEAVSFYGYVGSKWIELNSPVSPEFDVWYEGQVRFQKLGDDLSVAYFLKVDGQYSALTDDNGNVWQLVGEGYSGEIWNEIGLLGMGGVVSFDAEYYGKGLKIDAIRGK